MGIPRFKRTFGRSDSRDTERFVIRVVDGSVEEPRDHVDASVRKVLRRGVFFLIIGEWDLNGVKAGMTNHH